MRLRAGSIDFEASSRLTSAVIERMEKDASVTLPATEAMRLHELAFSFAELRAMESSRPESQDYADLLDRLCKLACRHDPDKFILAVEDLARCDEEESSLRVHALESMMYELGVSSVDCIHWRNRLRADWDGQRHAVQKAIGIILERQRAAYKNKKGGSCDSYLYLALHALAGVWQRSGEQICRSTSHSAQQGQNQAYTRRSRFALFARPFLKTVIGYEGNAVALSELVHKHIKQLRSAKPSMRRRPSQRVGAEA